MKVMICPEWVFVAYQNAVAPDPKNYHLWTSGHRARREQLKEQVFEMIEHMLATRERFIEREWGLIKILADDLADYS